MPCFCWMRESDISKERAEIRTHMKEIVRLIHEIDLKGDVPSDDGPMPRCIKADCHKLLDDLNSGKCEERAE